MYNCLYVLFYRGPLGRLANLAKSETLLKNCINKINKIAKRGECSAPLRFQADASYKLCTVLSESFFFFFFFVKPR